MNLHFAIVETVRDFDAPDGFVYQATTKLDFHFGWHTTLRRTTRMASGFPPWTHGLETHSLIATGKWVPAHQCRPVMKFETFEAAEAWLIEYLYPGAIEIETKARSAYIKGCDESGINPNRFPSWEELGEDIKEIWREKVK